MFFLLLLFLNRGKGNSSSPVVNFELCPVLLEKWILVVEFSFSSYWFIWYQDRGRLLVKVRNYYRSSPGYTWGYNFLGKKNHIDLSSGYKSIASPLKCVSALGQFSDIIKTKILGWVQWSVWGVVPRTNNIGFLAGCWAVGSEDTKFGVEK